MELKSANNNVLEIGNKIFLKLNILDSIKKVEQYIDPDLNKSYDVYLLTSEKQKYILKRKPGIQEKLIYHYVFKNFELPVPKQYGSVKIMEEQELVEYALREYVEGKDLRGANEYILKLSVKSLAEIHRTFLHKNIKIRSKYEASYILENYMRKNEEILSKLPGELFKKFHRVYQIYIRRYMEAPRTLVHGDLLLINIIQGENEVKIIDWELGHIGPYMTDLPKLLGDEIDGDDIFISPEYHEELICLYYNEICENKNFHVEYEQYRMDILLEMFHQRILCVIGGVLENKAEKNETDQKRYYMNLERSNELAEEILNLKL